MSESPLTINIQYNGVFCASDDGCWCQLLSDGTCQWSPSDAIKLENAEWNFLRHQACLAHTDKKEIT